MLNYFFPFDFWEGLSERKQLMGKTLLHFGVFLPIISIIPAIGGQYLMTLGMCVVGIVLAMLFVFIFRKRLESWWNDEGWRCPKCQERIGFSDTKEAFLLKGKMGNLPDEFTAWVECSKNHRSEINWKDAVSVMYATMRKHILAAETRANINKDKEDFHSQELYHKEKAFFNKALQLYSDDVVEEHRYKDLATLRQNLMNYSNRKWTPKNRDILYDMLANIIAYLEVRKAYEEGGLLFESNDEPILQEKETVPLRLYLEQIESFERINSVSEKDIEHFLSKSGYFDRSEEFIQLALESILDEKLHKKDWGGENNDLYTSNVIFENKRRATAFVLKGNGTGVILLKQKHIGYNGDQTIKAFNSPAELFILQFVGNIDENVIQGLELGVQGLRHQGKPASYCIIDGQTTARLLHAYNKI